MARSDHPSGPGSQALLVMCRPRWAPSVGRHPHRGEAMSTQLPGTLADRVEGQLIRPEDPDYEEARHVYNAMIEARPHVAVRCTGTDDVVAAVRYAAATGGAQAT